MSRLSLAITLVTLIFSPVNTYKSLAFFDGSGMGVFLALALPVDVGRKNIFLAYNFEASFSLPTNTTYAEEFLEVPEIQARKNRISREINRNLAYKVLSSKLERQGQPGKLCLLRAICEIASYHLDHNGVIADIIRVLFLPSTSQNENPVDYAYHRAELRGRNGAGCEKYREKCQLSIVDLITKQAHEFAG